MFADPADLRAKRTKVRKGFRPLMGIPEQGCGVVYGHCARAVEVKPPAVILSNFKVAADDSKGGNAAEADDDLGLQDPALGIQPVPAGALFLTQGVAVSRRPALDNVGNVYAPAGEIDHLQHIVQKFSGPADEGLTLDIFLLSRTLADKHDLGFRVSDAKNHMLPRLGQLALPALQTGLPQRVQFSHFYTALLTNFTTEKNIIKVNFCA
jgi:hypothetical protein